MGCGLRKLEDPDDSSPGKIFSTLKRPQVETKTDTAYEYMLLDFSLEDSSNPEVIHINALQDITSKVEEYYKKGYVVGAIHPVMLSVGRRRHLPFSCWYRTVLFRPKPRHKYTLSRGQIPPRLVIEEWSSKYEKLTSETVKEVLIKVNEAAKKGMRCVGFVTQHCHRLKPCNGMNICAETNGEHEPMEKPQECRKFNPDEHYRNCHQKSFRRHSSEDGEEEMQSGLLQEADFRPGEVSPIQSQKKEDTKLFAVFNVFENDLAKWNYQEGNMSMKITRKGQIISTLEADWLELTTHYYKQGLLLVDSFVYWDSVKDHVSKSLEGLFIYEEESFGATHSDRKGNDAIVVEQWTVIEGAALKTDYGPLLHTLAEFGWLLTCVLPTPILRHDSEGNLATKQIVFLQRPVIQQPELKPEKTEKKSPRHIRREDRGKHSSRSTGTDSNTNKCVEKGVSCDEFHLAGTRNCWAREDSTLPENISSFTGGSTLRDMDDFQLDQEDGLSQVTCM
ncbi:raftlin-2 [Protopterus annectens]|uniref:raftlin-2 n=1 Tax=Protopterus annectens TaxID=7888 RepID=UPI001CFB08F3|nr:raftlin-2 [Protopterus annectens]